MADENRLYRFLNRMEGEIELILKMLLETIKNIRNEYIEISIFADTDGNSLEVYEKIQGLIIQKKGTNEQQLLSSEAKLINNSVFFIVPIKEFFEIINTGNLKLSLKLDKDIVFLSIYNNLKENYILNHDNKTLHVNSRNKQSSLVEISIKNSVDITVYIEEIKINCEKGFKVIGGFQPKFNDEKFNVDEFFLKNKITNEIIQFKDFAIDYSINKYTINFELVDTPLYEGEWELNCLGVLSDNPIVVKVIYFQMEKVIGSYFNYNNHLYYHEISINKNSELVINIRKNNQLLLNSQLDVMALEGNKLIIAGRAGFNFTSAIGDRINELLFIHRETQKEVSYPLEIINDAFQKQIALEEVNFYEEKGIWDIYLGFNISGVRSRGKLNLNSSQESQSEDFLSLPKTIYNKWGTLRRIRLYSTLDKNLALLVRDDVMHCDVTRIDYASGKLIVKGSLNIPDIDYVLKDIYLEDPLTNLKLNCTNEFSFENGIYYYTNSCNWDLFEVNKFGETNFRFIVKLEINQNIFNLHLVSNADDIFNKSSALIYPALNRDVNKYPLKIQPYYSNNNELIVTVSNSLRAYCEAINVSEKNTKLVIKLGLEEQFRTTDVELVFKENKTGKSVKHKPEINENADVQIYTFKISQMFVNSNHFNFDGQWDVFLAARINDNIIESRVLGANVDLINKNSTFKSNSQKFDQELYFSTFFDKKSKNLLFEIRNLKAHEKKVRELDSYWQEVLQK
ncbi:hypothetical protein NDK43_31695 [Neobacillus pocheonensis]|uniref:Uncharacterized protein n=1 Tax=Neobacillus pocheonensis TaxID=363869 RepID=A0ABT0WI80_9BACI|nr:hypothetical protein [Neobacillus pocheonensis]